jgi:hypothetical protein
VGEDVFPEVIPGSSRVAAALPVSDVPALGAEVFFDETVAELTERLDAESSEVVCADAGP